MSGSEPNTENPQPTAPAAVPFTVQQRNWAAFTHLSALTGLVTGGSGFLLGPLVMWLIKKNEMPIVDAAGKEAINFQLTLLIGILISWVLVLILIGIPMLFAIGIYDVVMVIIATVQTSNGAVYRYPLTIRFFR